MATRAFAVLGLICGIASVVLVILYIVLEKLRNQLIYIIDVALCFITAGCILLSILIYESEVNNLSSGWALSVIALLLFNAAGALFFKEIGSIKVDAT
ncbi:hypothetical protein FSP39_015502 [Pinctada imbricata]|uniref:Uncharacterized protein n=1 Tax=Pinctada imbricata TaxID=66713 RepID=A0AA88XLP5_PINIB|nr:hypothetical protein FSP39_015502 [Pinctada imbricata]